MHVMRTYQLGKIQTDNNANGTALLSSDVFFLSACSELLSQETCQNEA